MSPRVTLFTLVLPLGLFSCVRHSFTVGAGATTDDRPVLNESQLHFFWGAIGETQVDTRALCPRGDALIEDGSTAGDWLWRWFTAGLYWPSTVEVYCLDEQHRASVQEQRAIAEAENAARVQQMMEQARQEELARQQAYQEAQAYRHAQYTQEPTSPSATIARPFVNSPQPPAATEATVTIERREVHSYMARASTPAECDSVIPWVTHDDPMMASQLTQAKREPCYRCVRTQKAFYLDGLTPLMYRCE